MRYVTAYAGLGEERWTAGCRINGSDLFDIHYADLCVYRNVLWIMIVISGKLCSVTIIRLSLRSKTRSSEKN